MYRKALIIGCLVVWWMGGWGFAMGKAPYSSPEKTQEAIDFTLEDIGGKMHTLSEYRGKTVVLNFWATWCPPCIAEMPSMQKLYETWDNKRFVMLAVDIGQSKKVVKDFADRNGYTFPILLDRDKKIAAMYKVSGIPTTYIIDDDGRVVNRIIGTREWSLKEVERLIK